MTLLKGFYCITEQSQEGKVSLTKQITVRTQRSFLREILNVFLVGTWIVDQALLEKKKKTWNTKKENENRLTTGFGFNINKSIIFTHNYSD